MASEIQLNASLRFAKSGIADGILASLTADWTGSKFTRGVQALSTSEEAINLGESTGGGGWFFAINRDATNSIHLRVATGATNFATLTPGGFAFFRWSTSATAPFAVASAGTPTLEYLVMVA